MQLEVVLELALSLKKTKHTLLRNSEDNGTATGNPSSLTNILENPWWWNDNFLV